MFLAYLGPETMLPMTSVVAGILGFLMMFGRRAVELTKALFRRKSASVPLKTRARGQRPTSSRAATPSAQRSASNESDSTDRMID